LSNSDISRRLKLPKSSASYILRVMEKRGYLLRSDSGKYRLGLKLMSLSRGQLAHIDVREAAKSILENSASKPYVRSASGGFGQRARRLCREGRGGKQFYQNGYLGRTPLARPHDSNRENSSRQSAQ
jgi:hypothetical protein